MGRSDGCRYSEGHRALLPGLHLLPVCPRQQPPAIPRASPPTPAVDIPRPRLGEQELPAIRPPTTSRGCTSRTSAFPITFSASLPAPLSACGAAHTEAPLFGLGSGLAQQLAPERQTHPSGGTDGTTSGCPFRGLPGEPPLAFVQTLSFLSPPGQLCPQLPDQHTSVSRPFGFPAPLA